jgi:tetratricopeptide (TPR) repeat protein
MVYTCCGGFISCTDILSNTAQVLTSLVEALSEDRSGSALREDGLGLLEEAIELFQRCLTLQEFHYAEAQAQEEESASQPQPLDSEIPDSEVSSTPTTSGSVFTPATSQSEAGGSSTSQHAEEEERWATIIEPVTNDTLLDTVLAQLETLTLLSEIIPASSSRGLSWIEEYSTSLLNTKLPAYVPGTDRDEEAALTRANFIAALANANFRSQRLDALTYQRAVDDAFGVLDLAHDPEGLCNKAEALIAYSSALGAAHDTSHNTPDTASQARWTALTSALEALTAASKLPPTAATGQNNLAAIHLLRGDVELLRYQLGQVPVAAVPAAVKSAPTLLKNAATYYRGAEKEAEAAKTRHEEDIEEWREAIVKSALVEAMGGSGDRLKALVNGADVEKAEQARRLLQEAVEAGLVRAEWLASLG